MKSGKLFVLLLIIICISLLVVNSVRAITSGTKKWAFSTNAAVSSPAIAPDGTIYVSSDKLYAINPDGTAKWSFSIPNGDFDYSPPVIGAEGTIYAVGSVMVEPDVGRIYLYAISPDGMRKWRFLLGGFPYERPDPALSSDGTIYVNCAGKIYAINPDGTKRWKFTTSADHISPPVVGSDGTVFVSSGKGIYAINPNGTKKWKSSALPGYGFSSPAIGKDGIIYINTTSDLYALNPNGSIKWKFSTEDGVTSSPAIGADGTIYVGSLDKNLYAIKGESGGLANSSWPMFHHDLRHTGRASRTGNHPPELGNAIWIRPKYVDTSKKTEAELSDTIRRLSAHNIKTVFITTDVRDRETDKRIYKNANDYNSLSFFIKKAHEEGIKVHALVAGSRDKSNLRDLINDVRNYNRSASSNAKFDGVQVDVEKVSGSELLKFYKPLKVPTDLVFSAAVQYSSVKDTYPGLLSETDLDLLVPMLYLMDNLTYKPNASLYIPTVNKLVKNKTQDSLNRINNTNGYMLTGLSSYDREILVPKNYGNILDGSIWGLGPCGTSENPNPCASLAFDPTFKYSIPQLVKEGKPLKNVQYDIDSGISHYRFIWNSSKYLDVIETTPLGLRKQRKAADYAGGMNSQYLGVSAWHYGTTFEVDVNGDGNIENYQDRHEGMRPDDNNYPDPQVEIKVVSRSPSKVIFKVTLRNKNPSEIPLGDDWGSGVHLQLENAHFKSAKKGDFHMVHALTKNGKETVVNGSKILELTKWFFLPDSQQATSGKIVVVPERLPVYLRYRGWIKDKDSGILNPYNGKIGPYVARTPDDVHYDKHMYKPNFSFLDYKVHKKLLLALACQLTDEEVASFRKDSPPDVDDPDKYIGDVEILWAVSLWINNKKNPDTSCLIITKDTILDLIAYWKQKKSIDQPLTAVRREELQTELESLTDQVKSTSVKSVEVSVNYPTVELGNLVHASNQCTANNFIRLHLSDLKRKGDTFLPSYQILLIQIENRLFAQCSGIRVIIG